MPTTFKVLAQSEPAANTNTNVYTVPNATQVVFSTIVFANRANTVATYRLAVRPDGNTLANLHYLAYDVPIAASDSTTLTLGITAAANTVVTAFCSTANFSINVFGAEITP